MPTQSAELIPIGDELVVVIDKQLKEQFKLAPGLPVQISSENGRLVLIVSPAEAQSASDAAPISAVEAAREGMDRYSDMLQRLAK